MTTEPGSCGPLRVRGARPQTPGTVLTRKDGVMIRNTWSRWLRHLRPCVPSRGRRERAARPSYRPQCEALEDRRLLSLGDLLYTVADPAPLAGEAFGSA